MRLGLSAGPGQGSFASKSSAAALINSVDLSLASVFVGGDDGVLRALNADGTLRWSFPAGGSTTDQQLARHRFEQTRYVQTPDGMLTAINAAGRVAWQARVGAVDGTPFQPSPGVGTSVYAIGTSGALVAVNAVGGQKWQFTPSSPIRGSLAFIPQSFNQGSQAVIDTIVYAVDVEGKAYGVRDSTGQPLQLQGCSNNLTLDCTFDTCPPDGTCRATPAARIRRPRRARGQLGPPEAMCGVLGRCSNDRNQVCIFPDACPTCNDRTDARPRTNPVRRVRDGTCEPLGNASLWPAKAWRSIRHRSRATRCRHRHRDPAARGRRHRPASGQPVTPGWGGRLQRHDIADVLLDANCPTDEICSAHCSVTTSQTCQVDAIARQTRLTRPARSAASPSAMARRPGRRPSSVRPG